MRKRRSSGHREFINEQPWQKADPSRLTPDAIAYGERIGIRPERMAWLLSCPKRGRATGPRNGGGST